MAITEQSRHRLRIYLEETMGEEQASAMMDHLLPVGWADLATGREVIEVSREVDELRRETTREFAAVRAEMAHEFTAVRAEMAHEFAAVRAEITRLRDWATVRFDRVDDRFNQSEARVDQTLKAEFARFEARIDRGFRRQTWALVTAVCALNGLVIAALRVG